ncbi:hypothetical protein J2S43_003135 [Catenuloplanes nepalensis]|uniref:Uncharacterized protein n=1 Tax=Catenuloplanes nepalensis TaxID=587533 RepID=A0ABT9MTB0_9ACTN|nr:hypothetical protein [Catenuloplanes nepalensis]
MIAHLRAKDVQGVLMPAALASFAAVTLALAIASA